MRIVDTDWSKLDDSVKTILERVDINKKSSDIPIGSLVDIPYYRGEMTEEMADEIIHYQYSSENKGYYAASLEKGILKIAFLKQAINDI
ncbi:hypothetical protein GRF59_14900 [Paenibacillus sp. HJL G12]|uniref:Uncharacterized protein n=1 Tax=Paenibacillus dendrobii TaxID=2691084 RepID=A0A7X3IJZ5_9BACL|nr:hypothetical protein [Paenibacillus dendrobii]MWV44908.1 hypothetical protein [Paenibacillus dendrobii]